MKADMNKTPIRERIDTAVELGTRRHEGGRKQMQHLQLLAADHIIAAKSLAEGPPDFMRYRVEALAASILSS
jgi:hypothetical protein